MRSLSDDRSLSLSLTLSLSLSHSLTLSLSLVVIVGAFLQCGVSVCMRIRILASVLDSDQGQSIDQSINRFLRISFRSV